MPSRRDRIRMTDAEVDDFLAGVHTLTVASLDADGAPHLVAMWYAVLDGRVAFWTYAKSQKIVNLRRDPRITVMAEAGDSYGELRGVSITGRAELSDDLDVVAGVGEALWPRYFGELDDNARLGVREAGRKRTAVFVDPVRVVSWDHRKE